MEIMSDWQHGLFRLQAVQWPEHTSTDTNGGEHRCNVRTEQQCDLLVLQSEPCCFSVLRAGLLVLAASLLMFVVCVLLYLLLDAASCCHQVPTSSSSTHNQSKLLFQWNVPIRIRLYCFFSQNLAFLPSHSANMRPLHTAHTGDKKQNKTWSKYSDCLFLL